MAFDYILFDLDGTLTNPYEGISKSVQYALKSFGIDEQREEVFKSFIGPPLVDSFKFHYGFTDEQAKQAVYKYRERYHGIGVYENELIDGVHETLTALKSAGKKLYLATSKPLAMAEIVLKSFDLTKYFDFLGGADLNFGRDEKIKVIRWVFESCGITDLSRAVIVGDRKYDVIGGRQAGIRSIGVLCGYGDRAEMEECNADFIAEKFSDILPVILE